MKRKGKTLTTVIIITAAVISLSIFARLRNKGTKDITEQSGIPVKAEKPQYMAMEKILSFTGSLIPKYTVTVLSKITGKNESTF